MFCPKQNSQKTDLQTSKMLFHFQWAAVKSRYIWLQNRRRLNKPTHCANYFLEILETSFNSFNRANVTVSLVYVLLYWPTQTRRIIARIQLTRWQCGNWVSQLDTSDCRQICHMNYHKQWSVLPMSLAGRIKSVKMNTLPKFMYLFQYTPIFPPSIPLSETRQVSLRVYLE